MATEYEILIDQGSRKPIIIGVKSDWLTDLTGYQGRMEVRSIKDSPILLATLSTYLTVDVPNMQVTLDIPPTISSAFTWKRGLYDIELFNGASVARILQGTIIVDREVTRG